MSRSNLEILAYEKTPLGDLCLRRRELLSRPGTVITEITLDHQLLMSSHNTVSERALATEALGRHPAEELTVLVAGLGLGYTAAAVLESPRVGRVDVIELFPTVIGFMQDGLVPLSGALLDDSRFGVRQGDAYEMLQTLPTERWDVVLIDVDHAPDDHLGTGSQSFYSREGLMQAKTHLTKGGILAVWSYAESSPFVDALREVFSDVEAVPVRYANDLVDEEHTDWLFIARDQHHLTPERGSMGRTNDTYVDLMAATEFVAIVTNGADGPHLVGTWGEYVRKLGPTTETVIVPAGGYRATEANLAKDDRVKLLIASPHVQGSTGAGQACEITGTAELVTEGPIAEKVKDHFPWARGALVVSVTGIATQL